MKISAGLYKSEHASIEHPVIFISDKPLDVWLSHATSESNILNLVPAQDWLDDPHERALALSLMEKISGRSIVPLLICPDDMDLSCTVVVAEQIATEKFVQWARFGYDMSSSCDQSGEKVQWLQTNTSITFYRNEFDSAIIKFFSLIRQA